MGNWSVASLTLLIVVGCVAQRDDTAAGGGGGGGSSMAAISPGVAPVAPDSSQTLNTAPDGTCSVLRGCADGATKMLQAQQDILNLLQTAMVHERSLKQLRDRADDFDDFDEIIFRNFSRFEIDIFDDLDDIKRNMTDDRREVLEDLAELRQNYNALKLIADSSGSQAINLMGSINSTFQEIQKAILEMKLDSAKKESKVQLLEMAVQNTAASIGK